MIDMLVINDVKLVGKYVAIRGDEILGFSEDKGKLIEEMKRKGYKRKDFSILYVKYKA
ncbi:DUF5678 domain-containing protein [Saccharolobus sp. A20]|uniref:DUF5678 domain-containing protein n=1 Tax=Saccharolobus sp. A20 TaxID=1891280 RepID=UPI0012EA9C93|nr:DUF5678 domain-containing protein [Sulfolobus sp. A20]